jgi:hypothetical protein
MSNGRPKDENDPTRLNWFARRVAEMKWWENSNPKMPAGPQEPPAEMEHQPGETASQQPPETTSSQEPQAPNDEQLPPTDTEPPAET